MRRGVRSHVRYADLAGHLTSAGMALQYYRWTFPYEHASFCSSPSSWLGAFSFFRRRELLFPPIRFIPPRCFRVRKTPQSLARFLSSCRLRRLPSGGKRFGAFRSRGGRHILLMNVPPPVRPVWNGGTPSAHSWRCRATVSAREYSCGEATFYQPFPYSPVDGFLVTLVPVRLRRFERPDWSSPFCSIATAFSIFWGRSVYVS